MDWNDLRFLLATLRLGSFSAAGRHLGVATTTVTRRIAALEESLGVRLFDRTPDGPVVTVDGERVAQLALGVEERVNDLERVLASGSCVNEPIRISTSEAGIEMLGKELYRLFAQHPQLRIELCSEQQLVSLARRQADIAVRLIKPEGQSLIIRKLADVELGLYAHRDYLERVPEALEDLSQGHLIGYDTRMRTIPEVTWFMDRGLDECFRLRTNSTRLLNLATLQATGIALMGVARAKGREELVRIPTEDPLPRRTAWLAYHEDMRERPGMREVVDWLVDVFTEQFA